MNATATTKSILHIVCPITALFQNCLPASLHDQSTEKVQCALCAPVRQSVASRKMGQGKLSSASEKPGSDSPNWSRPKLRSISLPPFLILIVPSDLPSRPSPSSSPSTSMPIRSAKKGRT